MIRTDGYRIFYIGENEEVKNGIKKGMSINGAYSLGAVTTSCKLMDTLIRYQDSYKATVGKIKS